MKATIYYSSPGVTGHMVINTERFFPCRKSDLTILKKVVDMQWTENTRKDFIADLLKGIETERGHALVDQRYAIEKAAEGKYARTMKEKKLAHFRKVLKTLDMDQEVVESWLQEPN